MIKVILGEKGSGKTAKLIASVNEAMKSEKGSIVFITNTDRHTYDLDYNVRLVVAPEYGIDNYEKFLGFLGGVMSQNFDISNIFIDGTLRIAGRDTNETAAFLAEADKLAAAHNVNILLTLSVNENDVPDGVKKFA